VSDNGPLAFGIVLRLTMLPERVFHCGPHLLLSLWEHDGGCLPGLPPLRCAPG
jgi:hypothetical protein